MKSFAFLLATGILSFTGVVHSNQCAGPACATQCPIDKDPVYTLQTPGGAWILSDAPQAAKLVGKKVNIRGRAEGNRITIISAKPVQ